jgi:hypothetical protein
MLQRRLLEGVERARPHGLLKSHFVCRRRSLRSVWPE